MEQDEKLNWVDQEIKELHDLHPLDIVESLKMEENKLYQFEIDFTKPFNKWTDPKTGTIKKIIPITHEGKPKNWWLSVRNPTYQEILLLGKGGKKTFQIMRTGQNMDTRYVVVK